MIRFLRNLFFHDWPLKLFSLTLAILTWLAVSISQRQKAVPVPGTLNLAEKPFFDLPISFVSRNADVSGYKADPNELDVTFQGSKDLLDRLDRADVHILVDLSDTVLRTPQRLPVEIIAPAGITYVRVRPDNLVKVTPPAGNGKPPQKPE